MADRPILMSAPMVRALLAGTKTQTRRVLRVPAHPAVRDWVLDSEFRATARAHSEEVATQYVTTFPHGRVRCPYGQPGDRLWVRENGWQRPECSERDMRDGADTWPAYEYDADGIDHAHVELLKEWGWKRRPSIHMPRWASRITLALTDVRVQRVQEISEDDALAEGADGPHPASWHPDASEIGPSSYVSGYRDIWNSINGPGSWEANPWAWALTFKATKNS